MRGLYPRIHHRRKILCGRMDRGSSLVKPAGDGSGWASASIQIDLKLLSGANFSKRLIWVAAALVSWPRCSGSGSVC